MTVYTSDIAIQIIGDSVTRDFPFAIPFMAAADVIVLLQDASGVNVAPPPVLNGLNPQDYQLIVPNPGAVPPYPAGATIRFNVAPATGYTGSAKRSTAVVQPVTLVDDAKMPATTINQELDRLTMIDQETSANVAYILGLLPFIDIDLVGLIMKWRGDWKTNTDYNLGDTVIGPQEGIYVAVVIHNSGAAFDASKWDLAVDFTTLNQAVADAQAAAILAQAAAQTIPVPGGAGNAGMVPTVNVAGNAYTLRAALLASVADPTNKWDAQNKLLTNVRTGVSANDAVNLAQMNAAIVAAGGVPAPAPGDVGKFLKATAAGVFAWNLIVTADLSDATAYMKGLLTSVANAGAFIAAIGAVPATRQIIAGTNLTGGGDLSADRTITHANSAVAPGSYVNANITVDARGHVTAAANGSVAAPIFITTAIDTGLDGSYRDGTLECTANLTVTLPNLTDPDKGFRVTILNNSATESHDVTINPAVGGQLIDGVAQRKIWPGTKLRLLWKGGGAWVTVNEGWAPATRAIATLGTEPTLDVSMMLIPANAREVFIQWKECQPVGGTGTDLLGRISVDGMATFDAGATNYSQVAGIVNTAGGSSGIISAGAANWTFSFNAVTNVALTGAPKCDGKLLINGARQGGTRPTAFSDFAYPSGAAAWEASYYGNHMHKTAHSIDGFRLLWSTAGRTFSVGSSLEVYWR